MSGEIRWGIVGPASIASGQFLPGLREAGGGRAVLVGPRQQGRAVRETTVHVGGLDGSGARRRGRASRRAALGDVNLARFGPGWPVRNCHDPGLES